MSFWIELHCDKKVDGADVTGTKPGCFSHRNSNPGTMTVNRRTAQRAFTRLANEALKNGWRKVGIEGDWACPFCKARITSQQT